MGELVRLVVRDDDAELPLALEVIEETTLEAICQSICSNKAEALAQWVSIAESGSTVSHAEVGVLPANLHTGCIPVTQTLATYRTQHNAVRAPKTGHRAHPRQ